MLTISIALSALFVTGYQAYLQRSHNVKSVRPIIQIDLGDYDRKIYVYIRNNGMGPMIIDKLNFMIDGKNHDNIEECVDLESTSYMHISINDHAKKAVLPNAHFVVFEKIFGNNADDAAINAVKKQLSPIKLEVNYRDIYDNRFSFEREFSWFLRRA